MEIGGRGALKTTQLVSLDQTSSIGSCAFNARIIMLASRTLLLSVYSTGICFYEHILDSKKHILNKDVFPLLSSEKACGGMLPRQVFGSGRSLQELRDALAG